MPNHLHPIIVIDNVVDIILNYRKGFTAKKEISYFDSLKLLSALWKFLKSASIMHETVVTIYALFYHRFYRLTTDHYS